MQGFFYQQYDGGFWILEGEVLFRHIKEQVGFCVTKLLLRVRNWGSVAFAQFSDRVGSDDRYFLTTSVGGVLVKAYPCTL